MTVEFSCGRPDDSDRGASRQITFGQDRLSYSEMTMKVGNRFNGHPNGKPKGCVESERHGVCRITIVSDAVAISLGYDPKILLRHEMGHCNGWRGHPGARVIGVEPD